MRELLLYSNWRNVSSNFTKFISVTTAAGRGTHTALPIDVADGHNLDNRKSLLIMKKRPPNDEIRKLDLSASIMAGPFWKHTDQRAAFRLQTSVGGSSTSSEVHGEAVATAPMLIHCGRGWTRPCGRWTSTIGLTSLTDHVMVFVNRWNEIALASFTLRIMRRDSRAAPNQNEISDFAYHSDFSWRLHRQRYRPCSSRVQRAGTRTLTKTGLLDYALN